MIRISSLDSNVIGSVSLNVVTGKIVSIELLEGDTERTDPEVVQYVNIQKNAGEHVDGRDVTHIDRLGQKLRCKVKFDRAGEFAFKVRLTPGTDNVTYSSSEKSRNANFKYSEGEIGYTTESNGEKIIEADKLFVSPAGGDVFTISARDSQGNEVTAAARIRTRRLLYYMEMKMRGLPAIVSDLSVFSDEFGKYGIEFKKLPSIEIEHIRNVDNNKSDDFKNKVLAAFNSSGAKAKEPYCIIIAYIDQGASVEALTITRGVTIDGTSDKVVIGTKNDECLWDNSIDDTSWFVKCYFDQRYFCGLLGTKTSIAETQCRPVKVDNTDWNDAVEVDISNLPEGRGEIVLKVNTIEGMTGGFSFLDHNIVTVCSRSWGKLRSESEMQRDIIHEVGHQLNMACDGSGKFPDKVATFYDGKGHVGRHCNSGLTDIQRAKSFYGMEELFRSGCVMYGCTNGKRVFCPDCAEALKKLSLEEGL